MASVLAGLAQNTGLKEVKIQNESSETDTALATAWIDMVQRNTSIKILNLADNEWVGGSISVEVFECLTRVLSCNTSLETLDLSHTHMEDSSVIALVDGLRINKTLKCLDLCSNCALSQSGRAAIERLIGYDVLKELSLAETQECVGASILASGLSDNRSLEKLNLQCTFVESEGPKTFLAVCESLRGNTTLRYLDVGCNDIHLDAVYATALNLDTMSLETLDLDFSIVTSCGIAALAQSLQGRCTIKELSLHGCRLDDTGLLKLGEALITNATLEVLDVRGNDFTHSGASQFFDLLPQMKGLKSVSGVLVKRDGVASTKAVGMALVDSLRKNTKLQKIFHDDDVITVDSFFSPGLAREINYYLGLNRRGRMLLQLTGLSEPPSGLWPQVLAKLSSPRDTSLLFYFLQNKPKIVKFKAAASRKRKAGNSALLE
jgi:Ran GTPase-activating protein (RanGAP) involved in mRNA processing and transport